MYTQLQKYILKNLNIFYFNPEVTKYRLTPNKKITVAPYIYIKLIFQN